MDTLYKTRFLFQFAKIWIHICAAVLRVCQFFFCFVLFRVSCRICWLQLSSLLLVLSAASGRAWCTKWGTRGGGGALRWSRNAAKWSLVKRSIHHWRYFSFSFIRMIEHPFSIPKFSLSLSCFPSIFHSSQWNLFLCVLLFPIAPWVSIAQSVQRLATGWTVRWSIPDGGKIYIYIFIYIYRIFSNYAGNFLTSCKPVSFSRRTLHHGVSK